MSCLMCKYFHAIEPVEHQHAREAGQCESRCGKEWDARTAIYYVKRHKTYLDGWCMLHPAPLRKNCSNVCGDIDLINYLTYPGWGIQPWGQNRYEGDTIYEWAASQMQTLMYGTDGGRCIEELRADNAKLKQQLQAARKISASRLERLKKQKPEPKPKQPVAEPPALRIVA